MDVFRLVNLSSGGRPVEVLNLEDPDTYWKVRDTLKFTPGPKKQIWSQSARRYGGARQVDETHENGTIEATWVVTGASEAVCLTNLKALLARLEDTAPGMFVEFRPDGAPYSTFWELRGTVTWNPDWKWVTFAGAQSIALQVSFPVEPIPRMPRMDVGDPFDVDSREDYLFDAATEADVVAPSGGLAPVVGAALTAERRMLHVARGYKLLERHAWTKVRTGTTITGFKAGVILRRSSPNTYVECYVDDNGTNSRARIDVVIGGVRTNRRSVNLAVRLPANTVFWIRGMIEEDKVWVHHFNASTEPTSINFPTTDSAFSGYPLTGPEIAGLPAGYGGLSWVPQHAASRIEDYQERAFVRRREGHPATIHWADEVPGTAPALCDLELTTLAGTMPQWAMFAWTPRPSAPAPSSIAPFGLIQAESAGALTTWVVTADGDYDVGSGLQTTAAGAGLANATWLIDPSTMPADPFTEGDFDLELWARIEMSPSLVTPMINALVEPGDLAVRVGQQRFTSEWGSVGRLLTKPDPTGSRFRYVRIGVIPLSAVGAGTWALVVGMLWAAGSTGVAGMDTIDLVPARRRALGPTGKPLDNSYPRFFGKASSVADIRKIVRHDQSGVIGRPPNEFVRDSGLGCSPIELPPGPISTLSRLNELVPDDPTSSNTSEGHNQTASMQLSVTPRVHMFRDA